jgi:acyl carrier protein
MAWPRQRAAGDAENALRKDVIDALRAAMGPSSGLVASSIQPSSRLGADLGMSSIDVARLAGVLQKRFGGRPLPFYTLLVKPDGTMLQDIRVSELVGFLERHLRGDAP